MDTFRVWEALTAGAIPLIEKGNAYDWDALPSDNPLVFIEKWESIHEVLAQFNSKTKVDAKQKEIFTWWLNYLDGMEQMVANIVS